MMKKLKQGRDRSVTECSRGFGLVLLEYDGIRVYH